MKRFLFCENTLVEKCVSCWSLCLAFFITVMQGRRKKLESVGHRRWKISWGLTFHLPPFCRLGAVLTDLPWNELALD